MNHKIETWHYKIQEGLNLTKRPKLTSFAKGGITITKDVWNQT